MLKRFALVAAVLLAATACGSSATTPTQNTTDTAGACTYRSAGTPAKTITVPGAAVDATKTHVMLATNRGDIAITLDAKNTPCTTNSFVSLASQRYFDGTNCHRLTTSGIFVLQCGDPTGTGSGGPGYEFNDELTPGAKPKTCTPEYCIYRAGTVAMANAGPGTNGSQFFLVYADSPLPYSYTIFGHMDAESLKVVQAIASHGAKPADINGTTAPRESVAIEKATVR